MRWNNIHKWGGLFLFLLLLNACARMGQPDGGWFDETPPRVIGAIPDEGAVHVKTNKVRIFFNEYIKLENATEKVVVSPPQLEQPEIKTTGKGIMVELKDTLKENTTYTIDFSDAISDNNEGNPLGNFTYTFSTGEQIDTMEVSGYVLNAADLEPVKGILVGLYSNLADSAFQTEPILRVSRTDDAGRFIIRGIAPGTYRVYALQDMDGNYRFSQKSEMIGFCTDSITPYARPDIRQDTIWRDSVHIADIERVGYTHFFPDNIVLRAFTEPLTDRFFLKSERKDPNRFTLYYSYGGEIPTMRGLDFDETTLIPELSARLDTITYWISDTALINRDTLNVELTYHTTDTLGQLQLQTDTVPMLAKVPYAKRQKQAQKEFEEWQKRQEKLKKREQPYDSIMPPKSLELKTKLENMMDPDKNLQFESPTPLARIDTLGIHLYAKQDTLWQEAPFELVALTDTSLAARPDVQALPRMANRRLELRGEWRPEVEYSLEIDSAAFEDIYGYVNKAVKKGFKVYSLDDYSTVIFTLSGQSQENLVVELLDGQDKCIKRTRANRGTAEFFFVKPGIYYARCFEDFNGNGRWDTGCYSEGRQAETVHYYTKQIECRAKWDLTLDWNLAATPVQHQKPNEIVKQKASGKKKPKAQNAQRAEKLGIPLPESMRHGVNRK